MVSVFVSGSMAVTVPDCAFNAACCVYRKRTDSAVAVLDRTSDRPLLSTLRHVDWRRLGVQND